jgi:hypothetical protein
MWRNFYLINAMHRGDVSLRDHYPLGDESWTGSLHAGPVSRAEFAMATAADDEEIRRQLREVPMQGAADRIFAGAIVFRLPGPGGYRGADTLLARRDGRLISVGAWSEREVWWRGEPKCVGYLHGLRMAAGTAGSMKVLREGYAELARQVAGSRRPGGSPASMRTTREPEGFSRVARAGCLVTGGSRIISRGWFPCRTEVRWCDESAGGIAGRANRILQREGSRHDLALTWDEARWCGLERSGFTLDDICVIRRDGRIVAAAGVWDQSAWKQVVVHGYPRWVRCMRPMIGAGAACLGWPGLPPEGGRVPLASVFPFAVAEGCEGVMPELWRGLEAKARARGIGWLALGLDASDPVWQGCGAREFPTGRSCIRSVVEVSRIVGWNPGADHSARMRDFMKIMKSHMTTPCVRAHWRA